MATSLGAGEVNPDRGEADVQVVRMITVPPTFVVDVLRQEGEVGRRWLDSLPAQVAFCCTTWGLVPDGVPMHGGQSLVVPVRRNGERAMLKLVRTAPDAAQEALALATWNGQGAVRLLAAQPDHRALLIERLDHRCTLGTRSTEEAFQVVGRLLRRLAVPAPAEVPRLDVVAAELAAALPERWERAGRPMARRLVDTACALAGELGSNSGEQLIHTDLYDDNVLAGEREPWLAIDPKIIAGEPAFGVAPLLWRRVDTMGGPEELAAHLDTLCAAAALDRERARAWSLVRCLDYWLWGLSVGLTEDPPRCARVVDWLGWR